MSVFVIGGVNQDIKAAPYEVFRPATSNPGTVWASPGGVGRNIAHTLALCGMDVTLCSLIGDDAAGDELMDKTRRAGVRVDHVLRMKGSRTGAYIAIQNHTGQMEAAVSDMEIMDNLTPDVLRAREDAIGAADCIVADTNIPVASLEWLVIFAAEHNVPLFLEPVSVEKAGRLKGLSLFGTWITPNADEFPAFLDIPGTEWAAFLTGISDRLAAPGISTAGPSITGSSIPGPSADSPASVSPAYNGAVLPMDLSPLMRHVRSPLDHGPENDRQNSPTFVVTLGALGVLLASRSPGRADETLMGALKDCGSPPDKWYGWWFPPLPARILDVNGAGDAFAAGLVAALLHPSLRWNTARAVFFAQAAAVLTLESEHTAAVDISLTAILRKLADLHVMENLKGDLI